MHLVHARHWHRQIGTLAENHGVPEPLNDTACPSCDFLMITVRKNTSVESANKAFHSREDAERYPPIAPGDLLQINGDFFLRTPEGWILLDYDDVWDWRTSTPAQRFAWSVTQAD